MQTNDHLPLQPYCPNENRYATLPYRRCGKSGIQLPALSIGLWHNFGDADNLHSGRAILRKAFDLGVTHFDLANNYGPPYGSAEENFGKIFAKDFKPYRNELILATKAGYDMWPGPYGRGGSKKYLVESCEASLRRMGVEWVDIFYHHCPDPETPVEETADGLALLVKQGKALYAGISNYYTTAQAEPFVRALKERGVPLLINQLRYSLLDRRAEQLFAVAEENGFGIIAFSPLEQGILTGKYTDGIPENSRAANSSSYLSGKSLDHRKIACSQKLTVLAQEAGISMSALSLLWVLRKRVVSSVLAGVSSVQQVEENVQAVSHAPLNEGLLQEIEKVVSPHESLI